ncbi:MAG: hypothetical protein ACFBZ8_04525 [Opitutales bacterium]
MPREPFSVYNTWGYHDTLGDQVDLSERIALNALKALRRWQDDFGLSYRYFVLDYGWFNPRKGFQFDAQRWPKGPERLLERLRAAGMLPGLWYSTNGYKLQVSRWKKSLCASGSHYSLVEGPFGAEFEQSLLQAADQWGVRYFKFDFAAFAQRPADSIHTQEEHAWLSRLRFSEMLARLRERFPDVRTVGHGGFGEIADPHSPGEPLWPQADPALLADFDHYFSKDPHILDRPQLELSRARDLDQDWGVWRRHQEGFPLSRIDDHGVMVGPTNTCFYIGRRGFQRSHLAQLARGARRDLFHGNPALLTDEDVSNIRRHRAWFFNAWRKELPTRFVGPGEPGLTPWHGYLTGGGHDGLLYLVNPHWQYATVSLELPGLREATVLFTDQVQGPAVSMQCGRLHVELGPESMVLLGLGQSAHRLPELQRRGEVPAPSRLRLLTASFEEEAATLTARLPKSLEKNERLVVAARLVDRESRLPVRIGKQTTRERRRMRSEVQDGLCVCVYRKGRRLEHEAQEPAVPLFCGASWVVRQFQCRGPVEIRIVNEAAPQAAVEATAYALTVE